MFDQQNQEKTNFNQKAFNQKPDKWGFLAEQTLMALRESYVGNPQDIVYQFSRRLAHEIVREKYQSDNEFVKEGVAVGVYKGIVNLMEKLIRK